MPAFPRLAIPDLPYHVTQRGNYRQDVFDTSEDRHVYLGYVAGAAIAYGLELHGWCLMTNHVHWIVVPRDQTAMAQTFRRAHSRFSAYVNRLRKRSSGHLWQGRYYSCPLDDQHLFRALLYVERNPVRAGLVKSAAEYEWSSVRARLGYEDRPHYLALYRWAASYSAAAWALLLDQGVGVEEENAMRASTQQGKPYGSVRFVEELEGKSHRVLQVRRVGRPTTEARSAV